MIIDYSVWDIYAATLLANNIETCFLLYPYVGIETWPEFDCRKGQGLSLLHGVQIHAIEADSIIVGLISLSNILLHMDGPLPVKRTSALTRTE
jgi:hypothetical protein